MNANVCRSSRLRMAVRREHQRKEAWARRSRIRRLVRLRRRWERLLGREKGRALWGQIGQVQR